MKKVAVCMSDAKRLENKLGAALEDGFRKHGYNVIRFVSQDKPIKPSEADLVAFVGVKSKKLWDATIANQQVPMIIDKGYLGSTSKTRNECYRISVGTYQPNLQYCPSDPKRLTQMGVQLKPVREPRTLVMFVGSSDKYNAFHGLPDAVTYSKDICNQLHSLCNKAMYPLVYRPKPSWWNKQVTLRTAAEMLPDNVLFSLNEPFSLMLKRCHCVVTYGSNGAVEALAAGVPVILLSKEGVSPVWHLANHRLTDVSDPVFPGITERDATLAKLAWCQFSLKEISAGFAWDVICNTQLKDDPRFFSRNQVKWPK